MIVIVFYKTISNTRLAFNLVTTDFFKPFCTIMLAFLFAIVYCGIRKYKSGVKVVRSFDRKIAQNVYCLYITIYSHDCTNIDDRYIYTDFSAVI